MKYFKHRTPEHVPQDGTANNHHLTWEKIKAVIDSEGCISQDRLDQLSRQYGQKSNAGNRNYANYLVRMRHVEQCRNQQHEHSPFVKLRVIR